MKRLISLLAVSIAVAAHASDGEQDPAKQAAATEAAMTPAERTVLTHGVMAIPLDGPVNLPADAVPGAGYINGIDRLGVPSLKETDASLGVAYAMDARGDGGATALPSGVAMASTWNPALIRSGGAMIGSEARAKGYNVMLAGGVNLTRDPRNGRNFEYLGEDPLLAGTLAGEAIAGIQSNHIISTVKHFALNGQETARGFIDVRISEDNARESDLLAFQIAIERGRPGAVMCSYNKINGSHACGSDWLLNQVLKRDWGFPGFVMSDWGAVGSLDFARAGLDQQSGEQLDPKRFFAADLGAAAAGDPVMRDRLSDMNRRILHAIYANGLDRYPVTRGGKIDKTANAAVAETVAREGIVLLRNRDNALPLAASARKIVVIGGYADTGVLSGGGSSQVHGDGGAAAIVPPGGLGPFSSFIAEQYQRSTPPLDAIRAKTGGAEVKFRNGFYIADAVEAAKRADVAIVFANQWQTEGYDQPDLSLPRGQDALIAAVAKANPNTIVVLQTGSAIAMPWLADTAAVLEAWYPGARGGEAIASVLFGETNPSGRLPMTFPASLDQLPRPVLDGMAMLEPGFAATEPSGVHLTADYNVEGSDLGYRWNARKGQKALFPFGFGLSYTQFDQGNLKVSGLSASFTVTNTGSRAGAAVPQVYLVSVNGQTRQRLAGFQKVELAPGATRRVTVTIDPRLVAEWQDGGWTIAGGDYRFALGTSAEDLSAPVSVKLAHRSFKP